MTNCPHRCNRTNGGYTCTHEDINKIFVTPKTDCERCFVRRNQQNFLYGKPPVWWNENRPIKAVPQ